MWNEKDILPTYYCWVLYSRLTLTIQNNYQTLSIRISGEKNDTRDKKMLRS